MQPQDRRHSVRIDPELKALRRGRAVAEPPAEAPPPLPVPAVEEDSPSCSAPKAEAAVLAVAAPVPAAPPLPGGRTVRLRRDGQRPLGFRGLELLCCTPPGTGDPADRLVLYLAEDGRVAAQIVRRCGSSRSRPEAFWADWIDGAADLGALLAQSGPADDLPEQGLAPARSPAPAPVPAGARGHLT